MLNFIRFDIKKLMKMTAFWIFLLLMLSIPLLASVLGYSGDVSYKEYSENYDRLYETTLENKKKLENGAGGGINIVVSAQPSDLEPKMDEASYEKYRLTEVENARFDKSTATQLVACSSFSWIIFAIFIANDFSTGYIKNILSIKGARSKYVLSKIWAAVASTCVSFIFAMLYGLGMIFTSKQSILATDWKKLLIVFVLAMIFQLIAMVTTVLIILITQSRTGTIVIGTLLAMGILRQIFALFSDWLNFDLSKILYSAQIQTIDEVLSKQTIIVVVYGLVLVVVFSVLNLLLVRKMDLKSTE